MNLDYKQVAQYHNDGYLLVPDVLNSEEVELLIDTIEGGGKVAEETRATMDAEGKATKLALWGGISDDIWSAVSTCPRVVNNVRILLGQEIAFYHGKVMLKEAKQGGAWEWHQDYGYWYNNGFAFPHMMSVFVALDEATVENGCLQVLKGSHLMGRLEHKTVGKQTGVDADRIPQLEPLFERVFVEMKPGSALFFHCNLLHASGANTSEKSRRSFIMCYNALNNPRIKTGIGRVDVCTEACPTGPDDAILSFRAGAGV